MADSDMLKAAKAEVERLKAELSKTPAYQKLMLAEQVVELYEKAEQVATYRGEHAAMFGRPEYASEPLKFKFLESKTKTAQIERAAVSFLTKVQRRATSGELLTAITEAGIEVGGKEPNKALSAYLSGFKSLNNSREHGGYGLVEWGDSPGPDQAGVFG
ncbi:hypothetical protein HNR60_003977 [Rhodopseudomonas rhenobacensis]|uniref:Uncharacterized protein n=1 Tax=Rhodopseudomonas rhenobacensis TaxID=87461 RepID=A0A7W8E0R7_9BRAD|nr:hypothetical protein [Rhodopseudomonas rhenobacensis]MBB5049202.1 hypothetical protein [Rhodopseudomonas rhenobacensis]